MSCLTRKNEYELSNYIKEIFGHLPATIKNAKPLRKALIETGFMSSDITVDQIQMLLEKINECDDDNEQLKPNDFLQWIEKQNSHTPFYKNNRK